MAVAQRARAGSPGVSEELTSFVGRQREMADLSRLFAEGARLVTVVGAGGVGKTRLGKRHAALRGDAYPGGVWFFGLADARSLDDLTRAVASALSAPLTAEGEAREALDRLGFALRARGEALLFFDNVEQIIEASREAITTFLARAPLARLLVTSREALAIPGEARLELAPLGDDEALSLLEARARGSDHRPRGFAPHEHEAALGVVRRLDGIPLAIELAATRLSVLTPSELYERLSERFKLLRTDQHGLPARSATLYAAIDWSWNLLSEAEQRVLAQCAVFRGGFSLEAAEQVIEAREADGWTLDLLQSLRQKSLLRSFENPALPGETRFDLFESILAYASSRLSDSGLRAAAEARHARYYADLGERLHAAAYGKSAPASFDRTGLELGNLLRAHETARGRDVQVAARAALSVQELFHQRGPHALQRDLVESVLAMRDLDPALLAEAYLARGRMTRHKGRLSAAEGDLRRAAELAEAAGRAVTQGSALAQLAAVAAGDGRPDEGRELSERALALHRSAGSERDEGASLNVVAYLSYLRGDFQAAARAWQRALELHRGAGDLRGWAMALGNLAAIERDPERARGNMDQALAISREVGDQRGVAFHLLNLAGTHAESGRFDEAHALLVEARAITGQLGERRIAAIAARALGVVEHARGRLADAERELTEALALAGDVGEARLEGIALASMAAVHAAGGRIEPAEEGFARAREALAVAKDPGISAVSDVLEAILELARRDRARARGDARAERVHHEAALERRAVAERRLTAAPGEDSLASHLRDVRIAAALVDAALARPAEREAPAPAAANGELEVGPECRWFRAPLGERVSLERNGAGRRVLLDLVTHRLTSPGAARGIADLLGAGWPGERVSADAGAARVYTAIRTLRKLGLRGILVTRDDGYCLRPDVEVKQRP
jgi:predicted ATPase